MPLLPVMCPSMHAKDTEKQDTVMEEREIIEIPSTNNAVRCEPSVTDFGLDAIGSQSKEIGLPRLMQNDALVLCGIDIPDKVDNGTLRVIVALKRVWYDAPTDIALIVRNLLPSGERRAAVVYRALGDDAEAVGLEVPMNECGLHKITVQIAKRVNGELIEVSFWQHIHSPLLLKKFSFLTPQVFNLDDRFVKVESPPLPNFGQCKGLCLRGIDVPERINDGTLRCIIAIERVEIDAPRALCLILRDVLPDGTSRSAVIRKISETEIFTMGIEVPLTEAGLHRVEIIVAESVGDEMAPIFYLPSVNVVVSNPPMPRLMEKGAVVLCGVDICGARWPLPHSIAQSGASFRATVALARTWDDAPRVFMLTARCIDANGAIVAAAARRRIAGMLPETLGLEAPLTAAGFYEIQVSILADVEDCGEFSELFELPTVKVQVSAAAPSPSPTPVAKPADSDFDAPVALKVSFVDGGRPAVIRRLTFPAPGTVASGPLFEDLMSVLLSAFRAELPPSARSRLTYVDDEGDEVAISSDAEVADALRVHRAQQQRCSGGTVGALRMTLARV